MQDTKAPLMDKLPTDRPPEIRVLAMPANTNAAGDIFGGWLMSQVDIAGSILAFRHADGRDRQLSRPHRLPHLSRPVSCRNRR